MMKNKTCIITGANSGLGYWTSMELAQKGAHVIMLCRSAEKGEKARKEISERSGNKNIELIVADLSSLASIREAVQKIEVLTDRVDILINNAALVSSQRILSDDGIEMQFAVNHIAPFYLTHLLLPQMMKASDGRIINVNSVVHKRGKIYFDDVSMAKNYQILRSYGQSKLANVFFSYELSRKLIAHENTSLSVYCVDPGHNNTPIGMKGTNGLHAFVWWLRGKMGSHPSDGAKCQIDLAMEEKFKGQTGKYWKKSRPVASSKYSCDEQAAAKLWQLSMDLCRLDDYFRTKQ